MAKYIENPDPQFMALGSGVLRGSGTHMTGVIRDIERTLGRRKIAAGWNMDIAGEVGFLWEDLLSLVYASREVFRPDEIVVDGIHCSPDGIGPDPGFGDEFPPNPDELIVFEYKVTWRSNKDRPTGNWYWMTQLKGYCHAVGTDTAHMDILYLMGNYRGSGPTHHQCRITFTEREISQNWNMIVQHKEKMHG